MEKKISFEEGMQELETLVKELESGEMSLDDSFRSYEKAVALRDSLKAMLDESDQRIRVLTESGEHELDQEAIQ